MATAPGVAASFSESVVEEAGPGVASRAAPGDRFGLVLSGIAATNASTGGMERTAILTARTGDALLVRAGDSLPGNWRVVSVTDASVMLEDTSGATRRLDLP